MRITTLLQVLLVLALCFVGWGFYAGWFTLSRGASGTQDNKVNVTLTVDGEKARADAKAVETKVKSMTGSADSTPAGDPEKAAAAPHE